ncbi:hypothetical protein Q0590_06120 [Rhodocytophaga aerolata]|uniref:Uncharacterized protein n=1 Tax=Rhodocytophaga aerolata TaxID=455078 RepID=A0ABT8R152_9BACT|nr:hypothetical protein [Rhodocytophaga aerolata]MDO1445817.1 hypothetical protein [Rhodocytophaga aerolata]
MLFLHRIVRSSVQLLGNKGILIRLFIPISRKETCLTNHLTTGKNTQDIFTDFFPLFTGFLVRITRVAIDFCWPPVYL